MRSNPVHGIAARVSIALVLLVVLNPTPSLAENPPVERLLGRVQSSQLDEISGMAASRQNPDVLWVHNDGAAQHIYGVDTNGRFVARVGSMPRIRDSEDIALGPGPQDGVDYLYLGDIGDNETERSKIRVFRLAEPILRQERDSEIAVIAMERFQFVYPHGGYNAEALLVDPVTGDLFIVTKEEKRARVFVARADSLQGRTTVTLRQVARLDARNVSGGDISRDGSCIVLRRETTGWFWKRPSGESVEAALARPPQRIPVRCPEQGINGEAIAISPDGRGYYTVSEGKRQAICFIAMTPAAD